MWELVGWIVVFAVQVEVFIRVMNGYLLSMRDSRKKIAAQTAFTLFMLVLVPFFAFYYRDSETARNVIELRFTNLIEVLVFVYFAGIAVLVVFFIAKGVIHWTRPRHVAAELFSETTPVEILDHRWREDPHREESRLRRLARLVDDTYRVDVTSKTLVFDSLPAAFDGLRMVQISDLHYDRVLNPFYFERCMDMTMQLQGDVIVITGDLVTRRKHLPAAVRLLSRLRAPLGVYVVRGNHDFWTSPHHCRELIERAGMTLLDNHVQRIEKDGAHLWLVGTEHPWKRVEDWSELLGKRNGDFKVLLSHTPDNVFHARRGGVNLVLSGHTHGGQVCLPVIGSILVPSRYSRRFNAGLFDCHGTLLYVNRGLGTIPPPIRLHCPAEITVVVLKSAQACEKNRQRT